MIRIASFDIGKKNFAFYVEDCSSELILKLNATYSKLPKNLQRRVKGPMNQQIQNIVSQLCNDGKRVEMGVFDIRADKESNTLDIQTRANMQKLLKEYESLWDSCDIFVIEQQYFNISNGKKSKATGANVDAIKLAEICAGWLIEKYHPFKTIIEFGAMYKTQTMGAPDNLTKPQRKKWSIEFGTKIFESRNDQEGIDILNSKKNSKGKKQKQDDVYDCVIMTQAYKFRKMIIS